MNKSAIPSMPRFFDRYILLAEDAPVTEVLEKHQAFESAIDADTLKRLGDKRYAPGKWTVKDILQHIIDNERVQSYRALRIARNDQTSLPGYDENLFADHAQTERRTVDDLLEEFRLVRRSSILLFRSLPPEMLLREGTCNNITISPLALGFMLAGHQIHHVNVLKERYLAL
ncbi:DinB family protein [Paraflavisolibacter sp. H34]|uniref:DinB family protein n=1 Tax=Huijunlia imazamoxiresistens TaxID=3127457 RepID=UPI0030163D46